KSLILTGCHPKLGWFWCHTGVNGVCLRVSCAAHATRIASGKALYNASSSDSQSGQAMDIIIILTNGAEHIQSQAEILSDSRGVLLLSGASQHTYRLSSGASSAAAQTRILTGERTLCPDGSGSQKFGYIQVSPITKYFYAAIEADRDPGTAPTFVYFEGGPGGSSLTAALRQNGPCIRDFDTRRLRLNLKRIDAPAPTGFSVEPVARGTEDFMLDLVDVITKFTQRNPIFNRDLHLVGTSSSAAFVAMLAARLAEKPQPQVRIVGVMLISGVVSPAD
ncbi:hypothetical protein FOZ62_023874, partial [Perkinsus olseni]